MRAASLRLGLVASLAAGGCKEVVELERQLSSFEITITTPAGSPDRRCLLPGSSTTGVDLSGCPIYEHDAAGNTVARVNFVARAVDNRGALLETYDSIATVAIVPGRVEPAFRQLRFNAGVAEGQAGLEPAVAFRAAYGDTYLWIKDETAPPRSSEVIGLGTPCDYTVPETCDAFPELGCINTAPLFGYDPQGLAYCSRTCAGDATCPDGYRCAEGVVSYSAAVESGGEACVRVQPSYSASAAGPIHFVEPNLADVNRADSLISSPFQDDFVDVQRGNMVVTAVRIDGFYVTDTCALPGYQSDGQALCTPEELAQPNGFNHLFVFNFSRPDDLFPGDRLIQVSGPITEFNGLTEIGFPLWEIDYARSPQTIPAAVALSEPVAQHFPVLIEPRGRCANIGQNPQITRLVECDYALERLEAARITVQIRSSVGITPGSRDETNFDRFGQWPVIVDDGSTMGRTFQVITRENIPFFDPRAFGARTINQPLTGNLRQVAFDDRSEPIWIVEPRDQADCPWCVN